MILIHIHAHIRTDFVQNLLPKLDLGALREASKALGMEELPEEVCVYMCNISVYMLLPPPLPFIY